MTIFHYWIFFVTAILIFWTLRPNRSKKSKINLLKKLEIDIKSMAEGYKNGLIFFGVVRNGKVIHNSIVSKTTKSPFQFTAQKTNPKSQEQQ